MLQKAYKANFFMYICSFFHNLNNNFKLKTKFVTFLTPPMRGI